MLRQSVPIPDQVGQLYDRFAAPTTVLGYNQHVGYWDDLDSEASLREASDRLTDMMTERLKIDAGSRLLDVGCGIGGPAMRIARLTDAQVTGISVSQEQITLANTLAESAGLSERVTFKRANAMEMPFPDRSFDAAIALESMPHMPDRGQVLMQICRTLRPGGRLVLTDFFERAPIPAVKQPAVERFLTNFMNTMVQAESYPPLLRQAGLWFEEILDISDKVLRKSFTLLSNAQAEQEVKAKLADETIDQLDETDDLVDISEFGYLMIVAKRPEE